VIPTGTLPGTLTGIDVRRSESAALDLPKSVMASRENALHAPFWSCHVDANDGSFFRTGFQLLMLTTRPNEVRCCNGRDENSKTHAEAAVKAGYPVKNARQSAYQALQRGRVPDLMNQLGLTEEHLIDKHLRRHLNAKRTAFFQKDGKVKESRKTEVLEIQTRALDMAFELHGSYAPRDPKEAEQFGIKVVVVDIPRPPRNAIDVTPSGAGGNGTPPTDNEGHD
jgi:hypothetical protein